jgi:hypothetical protein
MRASLRNAIPSPTIAEERTQLSRPNLPADAADQISMCVRLLARSRLCSHSGSCFGSEGLHEVLTAMMRSGALTLLSQPHGKGDSGRDHKNLPDRNG